jgi:DNA replication protein DnaC
MTRYSKARRQRMTTRTEERDLLVECLKELHLPAFRSSYEELARQAQQESQSYEQYLLGLSQRECQERRDRRTERLLRASRLPLEKRALRELC